MLLVITDITERQEKYFGHADVGSRLPHASVLRWNPAGFRREKRSDTFLIYFYYLFFHRRPTHKLCFLFCMSFGVNATFSTGLVVSSVSWLGQLTVG